jgi:hypothetical protein
MPSALELATAPRRTNSAQPLTLGDPGAERKVVRDFAVLLGAALTIGVTAAVGMVIAVLVLA